MEAVSSIGGNRWDNLSSEERARQIAEREEKTTTQYSSSGNKKTFSILKNEAVKGIGNLRRGVVNTGKGIAETTVGLAEGADAVALGLGVIAIMTVGTLISPVPAALSREKNIIDVNKEVFAFAQTPKSARFVGYPLLALVGGFGIMQAAKMFK